MNLAIMLRNLLFGEAKTKAYRDVMHDSKGAMQASSGEAWRHKRASDEVFRSAQCTIKLLERSRDDGPDK